MIDSLDKSNIFWAFPVLFFNRKIVLKNDLRVMCVLLVLHMPTIFLTTVIINTIKYIRK